MCKSGVTLDEQGNIIHERSGKILKVWRETNSFTGEGHFREPSEPSETSRHIKKEIKKKKEPDFKNDVFVLCKNIFKKDKTPAYTYNKRKSDKDKLGKHAKNGQRWLTPSEMVLNFVKENFPDREKEMWKFLDEKEVEAQRRKTEVPNSSQG